PAPTISTRFPYTTLSRSTRAKARFHPTVTTIRRPRLTPRSSILAARGATLPAESAGGIAALCRPHLRTGVTVHDCWRSLPCCVCGSSVGGRYQAQAYSLVHPHFRQQSVHQGANGSVSVTLFHDVQVAGQRLARHD